MKKNVLLLTLIVIFTIGCQKNEPNIKGYSEKLQIDFPNDMNLIYFNRQSDFQDYTISSVYRLSFNQKNALLDQIINKKSTDNLEKISNIKWDKCESFYSIEYSDESEGLQIYVILAATNYFSTLSIHEIKI